MRAKKAQVTLFIMVGIIILLLTLLMILALKPKKIELKHHVEKPIELQPLKSYVESCIKDIAIPGIYLLGVQGGYIYPPNNALETDYTIVGYGYYEGANTLPSIQEMQTQISRYIDNALPLCTNFSIFKEFGVKAGKVNTKTTILENEITIEVYYPLTTVQEHASGKIDTFLLTLPVRLGHIHKVANEIVNKEIGDPEWIDLTFLSGFDTSVSIVPYDETTFIHSITDNVSKLTEPYVFLFANKFVVNQPPRIDMPDTLTLRDGVVFTYKVNVTDPDDDYITFSDDTAMFDILDNGLIVFTPEVTGNFNVTIRAEDDHNNYDEKTVLFMIEE
jgi:hypothetical protein